LQDCAKVAGVRLTLPSNAEGAKPTPYFNYMREALILLPLFAGRLLSDLQIKSI
jgi:hypothetical protein